MKTKIILLCIVFITNIHCFFIYAQVKEVYESEGKDFYLTFMPNYHNNFDTNTNSLYIFITSKTKTTGSIYYKNYNNGLYKDTVYNFQINYPNEIHTFKLTSNNYELQGFNHSGTLLPNDAIIIDNEKVTKNKTFHIKTTEKSTVYAVESADKTAEAFIVLPTPSLGKEYFILTYKSDGKAYDVFKSIKGQSTPSQFAIVATEDSTSIFIKPSCPTFINGTTNQNIILNKGEVYFVQANITYNNLYNDLTGTYISSNKNIAVFAGHQRASIPTNPDFQNPSRDCLIEQLIPVNAWGKNAIIIPFIAPVTGGKSDNTLYPDIYRVIASKDSSIIILNGQEIGILNAGETLEGNLIPGLITSNKPIMVAQYNKTTQLSNYGSGFKISGDPSMLIVPPVEQYKKSYNIVNVQLQNDILEQYLNIISSDSSINKIYIDNQLIPESEFKKIKNTGFSYAQIKTTDGGHNITSEDNIGVQIYGYGTAISYSYTGGMNLKNLEKEKIVKIIDTCNNINNILYNETFSSGIKYYEILSKNNCNIIEKSLSKHNLQLEITKLDISKIAFYSLKIVDIYNEETIFYDTIDIYLLTPSITDNLDFGNCKIGSVYSRKFYVKNNSSKSIDINANNLFLYNKTNFTISQEQFPATLNIDDSMLVTIYYSPLNINHIDYDTLEVRFSSVCKNNKYIYLQGTPIADTLNFNIKCNIPIQMIADSISNYINLPIIYPNPTKTQTLYKFYIPKDENINISIFDINGNYITNILNSFLKQGVYEIVLPINNLPAGEYIIKQKIKNTTNINKLIKL